MEVKRPHTVKPPIPLTRYRTVLCRLASSKMACPLSLQSSSSSSSSIPLDARVAWEHPIEEAAPVRSPRASAGLAAPSPDSWLSCSPQDKFLGENNGEDPVGSPGNARCARNAGGGGTIGGDIESLASDSGRLSTRLADGMGGGGGGSGAQPNGGAVDWFSKLGAWLA